MDYSEEIRNRVRLLTAGGTAPVSVAFPKKDVNLVTIFLGTMLVLMSLTIVFVAIKGHSPVQAQAQTQPVQIQQTVPKTTASVGRVEYLRDVGALNARITDLDKKVGVLGMRDWIVGVAHNENTHVYQKAHPNEQGYITLDEEWRMSKLPETMQFSPEQKEELKNWIAK